MLMLRNTMWAGQKGLQEAQLMLTKGSTRFRSVEVKKHFESIPSKIKKNNSE